MPTWRAPNAQQKRSFAAGTASESDLPSLLDIFQFLDSPDPSRYLRACLDSTYSDIFEACLESGVYAGMRTSLYQYQKNSVFKMLKRELLPDLFLSPDLIPTKQNTERAEALAGQHPLLPYFQFSRDVVGSSNPWMYRYRKAQSGSASVATDRALGADDVQWYQDTRGGIICEDMGTGKTCECLALILLTKRQMARPPTEGDMIPQVGTAVSGLCTDMTNSAFTRPLNSAATVVATRPDFPTLSFLTARAAMLSCAESLRLIHEDGLLPTSLWKRLSPFSVFYWVCPMVSGLSRRSDIGDKVLSLWFKVYMSSSTLVVVPDNLIDQWVKEKYKHIDDTSGFSMLKIDHATETVPDPKVLITYDLVLVSVSRLSKEYTPIETNISELGNMCRCWSLGYDHCMCNERHQNATDRSPLLRVHWKRLIVDEGHIMSSRNTMRSLIAAYIIADRRWVCTGTPTHNLVHATAATGVSRHQSETEDLPYAGKARTYRLHRKDIASDFLQLGMLVAKFMRLDPFAQATIAWRRDMVGPYRRNDPGAHERLQALMQAIMVRTRPEVVSSEIQLPPLHERLVVLPPTHLQMLVYNTVVAFFHINAVLTEREGRDYFFHAENKKHLRQVTENLFLACSWFPISITHVADGIDNGKKALAACVEGKKTYSPADIALLHSCIAVLERAASDLGLLYAASTDSVGYWVSQVPQRFDHLVSHPTSSAQCLTTAASAGQIVSAAKAALQTSNDNLLPLSTNLTPPEFELLSSAEITGTTSNKVSYLIDQLVRHSDKEKCIVFANNLADIVYVDDALRVLRIPHLLYAHRGLTPSQQRHNVTTFATSATYNVIIMDVQLAAYGIDLSAASRVWFMSPVWQSARERQAIKRAHRLGQTRPVFVETLVMEGSVEEDLWRRRQELATGANDEIIRDIEEDSKMRSVLSNARFVGTSTSNMHGNGHGMLINAQKLLPRNIKYPKLLMRKYAMWFPEFRSGASSAVGVPPFAKTRRLRLKVTCPVSSEPTTPANTHFDEPQRKKAKMAVSFNIPSASD